MSTILGIDTGFAALGWAKLMVTESGRVERVIDCGVIATEKGDAARSSEDDVRRIDELIRAVVLLAERADLVAYELPAGAQGARAAHTLGTAHGLIRGALLDLRPGDAPLMHVTPREVKLALAGRHDADKRLMIERASAMRPQVRRIPATLQEHAADAIGVTLAALRKVDAKGGA